MTNLSYKKAFQSISMGIAISLSGCMGVYEGGFECPPGEGVKCKSISEVNHMVNQHSDQLLVINHQLSEDSFCGKDHSCMSNSEPWYWIPPEDLSSQLLGPNKRKPPRAPNSI